MDFQSVTPRCGAPESAGFRTPEKFAIPQKLGYYWLVYMVDCRRNGGEQSPIKEESACPRRVGPGAGGG
jgi:hypothetical protein